MRRNAVCPYKFWFSIFLYFRQEARCARECMCLSVFEFSVSFLRLRVSTLLNYEPFTSAHISEIRLQRQRDIAARNAQCHHRISRSFARCFPTKSSFQKRKFNFFSSKEIIIQFSVCAHTFLACRMDAFVLFFFSFQAAECIVRMSICIYCVVYTHRAESRREEPARGTEKNVKQKEKQ